MLAETCQWLWELQLREWGVYFAPTEYPCPEELFQSPWHRSISAAPGTSGSCEVSQTGTVEQSSAVFFSDCTKLNLDYGAEIYIYFIIDLIKSSMRKQKLWAMWQIDKLLKSELSMKKQLLINYQLWKSCSQFFVEVYVFSLFMAFTVRSASTEFSYATNLIFNQAISLQCHYGNLSDHHKILK